MAGTNTKDTPSVLPNAPAIILVEPQMGENIGMCARAMLNCGITDLRLVAPRDGWPNPAAEATASGAITVIENAQVFNTTKEAVADLKYILATTARERDMIKTIHTPETASAEIHKLNADGNNQCGILFGPERAGLNNDNIALSNAILNVPLNPGFTSLNLAQAVLLMGYSWWSKRDAQPDAELRTGETELADQKDVEMLAQHIEDELSEKGFFRSETQKPSTIRNIRNFFFRIGMTRQEVHTLHGIICCITGKQKWK